MHQHQIGSGFSGTLLSGKTHNDEFYVDNDGRTRTRTNRSGGVQGGISNGETIVVRVVRGLALGRFNMNEHRGGRTKFLKYCLCHY